MQSCKVVAPILENLAEEYEGKVDIYKVDTEKEQGLDVQHRSIPSILFMPKDGKPQMSKGALPKENLSRRSGCSPGSRADRFLNGSRGEIKFVGGSNRIIGKHPDFQDCESLFSLIHYRSSVQKKCAQLGEMECRLLILADELEAVRMNELAERLGVSESRITRLVERMVKKGLVTKHRSTRDRRS